MTNQQLSQEQATTSGLKSVLVDHLATKAPNPAISVLSYTCTSWAKYKLDPIVSPTYNRVGVMTETRMCVARCGAERRKWPRVLV